VTERTQIGFLYRVLGLTVIAQYAAGNAPQRPVVLLNQPPGSVWHATPEIVEYSKVLHWTSDPGNGSKVPDVATKIIRNILGVEPVQPGARKAVRAKTEGETEMRNLVLLAGIMSLLAGPALAQNVREAPPPAPYKKVSTLVKLPDFLPGLGTL
jgi:hypothetical protein